MTPPSLEDLAPTDPDTGDWNVIIETPKGRRNKYKYDEAKRLMKLKKMLPAGMVFPFDFGFLPHTEGGDGDPLDVLVLMDEPAFPGCLVVSRPIGVLVAEQTEEGETYRNDRLIAVSTESLDHAHVRTLEDLNENLRHEIEHFFTSYQAAEGKELRILERGGPDRARQIVATGDRR